MCALVSLCSFSQKERTVMLAHVAHCQINKNWKFILDMIFSFYTWHNIRRHFVLFCHFFWFDSGSTGANAQCGSQPKQLSARSQWTELFSFEPTEIVANRWGKRSFLPTSTFTANLQNLFNKALLSKRWGKMCVCVCMFYKAFRHIHTRSPALMLQLQNINDFSTKMLLMLVAEMMLASCL